MEFVIAALISFSTGLILAVKYFPFILDYVIEKSQKRGFYNGPWKTHLGVGRKKTAKIEKAAIARVGLGANSSDETIYWNAFTDSDGNDLDSRNEYQILFNNDLPIDYINKGFWSITIYGEDKFLVVNPQKKYMIRYSGDNEGALKFPLVLNLSRLGSMISENSIPLPPRFEKFSVALRCYRPLNIMKEQSTSLSISMPLIKKIL